MATNDPPDQNPSSLRSSQEMGAVDSNSGRVRRSSSGVRSRRRAQPEGTPPGANIRRTGQFRNPRDANSNEASPGRNVRRTGQTQNPLRQTSEGASVRRSGRQRAIRPPTSEGGSVRRSGRQQAISDPERSPTGEGKAAVRRSGRQQAVTDSSKSGVRRRSRSSSAERAPTNEGSSVRRSGRQQAISDPEQSSTSGRAAAVRRSGQQQAISQNERTPTSEGASIRRSGRQQAIKDSSSSGTPRNLAPRPSKVRRSSGGAVRRTNQIRNPVRPKSEPATPQHRTSDEDTSSSSSFTRNVEPELKQSTEEPSEDQVLAVIKPQRKVAIRRNKPATESNSKMKQLEPAFENADDFFGDDGQGDELGNYSDDFLDDPLELDELDDGPAYEPPPRQAQSASPPRKRAQRSHAPEQHDAQMSSIDAQMLEQMVEERLAKMESKLRTQLQKSVKPAKADDHGHEEEEKDDLLPMDWGTESDTSMAGAGSQKQQKNRLDFFLSLMIDRGASDFHLHVGNSPMFRQGGEMIPMRYRPIRQRDWARFIRPICPEGGWERWETIGDVDFAYEITGLARFRVNLFTQHAGGGAVFRVIPTKILTLDELGMPPQLMRFAELNSGLVLITGPTGSGKSTTLAAIIDMINTRKNFHIITIEDPIEFVHSGRSCIIHQREIGTHAATFNAALTGAVREDPDLILVGEMRDQETVKLALEAAEKGVLVFGTLHTNSATKTIDRIINVFPISEQAQIRSVLADTIEGVVSQQLLRRTSGGRVAALEIMFSTSAMGNIIREGKTTQLTSLIQTGVRLGMVAMDDSLLRLVDESVITPEAAIEKAIEKDRFKHLLGESEEP